MTQNISINTRMAGIPPGCNRYGRMIRGCRRVAPQPPANGGHPSGMHPPQTGGLPDISRGSSEAAPPDMTPRRFPQTGGLPAVSRGSSEATPPDMEMKTNCIPEGCQPTRGDARFANATQMESGK